MNSSHLTLAQIRQVGLEVLARHLGPVGMVRFLQHSETGHGNYTEARHQWLENKDVRSLAADILAQRKGQ
jgi:hypothetical protein